jgi:hypothetical protein
MLLLLKQIWHALIDAESKPKPRQAVVDRPFVKPANCARCISPSQAWVYPKRPRGPGRCPGPPSALIADGSLGSGVGAFVSEGDPGRRCAVPPAWTGGASTFGRWSGETGDLRSGALVQVRFGPTLRATGAVRGRLLCPRRRQSVLAPPRIWERVRRAGDAIGSSCALHHAEGPVSCRNW